MTWALWAPLGVYAFGFMVAWFVATRHWLRRFPPRGYELSGWEAIEAGVWGFMAAVFWPLAGLGWLIGRAAS